MSPWVRLASLRRSGRRRRLLEETLERHPVSLTRQRAGTALFVAMLLGLAAYYATTQDAAIKRRAEAYLREVTSADVRVGAAHFSMFGGIKLEDVHISVPFSETLDPSARDAESREIFHAHALTLRHNPWRLLLGSFRIERIIVARPSITLVHNIDSGERNWRLLLTGEQRAGPARAPNRPRITVRSARVVSVAIDDAGRRKVDEVELDADVRPHAQIDTAYCIEIRRLSEPADRTMVVLSPDERLLTNTPFVDVRTLGMQLPRQYQRLFERIQLEGEVKLARLTYSTEAAADRDDALELRNVRCVIPLAMLADSEADPAQTPPSASGIVMTEVAGEIKIQGRRLELNVKGRVNGAPCSIVGAIDDVAGALSQTGLSVEISCRGLPMPEGALRESILANTGIPRGLRRFLSDYDPRGRFDINGRIVRDAAESGRTTFEGTIRPLRASASYHRFPYRVSDLEGVVRFENDRIHLEQIRGRHGAAPVLVNGVIDRTRVYADVDVDIVGASVPLDKDLFSALSPQYRAIWKRFDPRGLAGVHLHVRRTGADADEPIPRWRNAVTIDLLDSHVTFAQFPYPLEDVHGRIRVSDGVIELLGVIGHHGGASVRIDGYATMGPDEYDVELRLEARSLPLDETLANALPASARSAFSQFRPQGLVDLVGTVTQHGSDRSLRYDLIADLRDARIQYDQVPYALDGISGRLHIRPDNIVIIDVQGRHGAANITGHGSVRQTPDGIVADLEFDCRDVPLDGDLQRSLPARVRSEWDRFRPSGTGHIRTRIHYEKGDGPPIVRHRTEIEIVDGSLFFDGLPMKLESVNARLRVSDRRVELLSLDGQAGGGSIDLSGTIELDAGGRRGVFALVAKGITPDSELVDALPERLRRFIRDAAITGNFDVRLDSLRFDEDASGGRRWDFEGELTARDAGADLGIAMRGVEGRIIGKGSIRGAAISLDARADFAKARLGRWQMERLQAHILREIDSNTIRIQDVSADLYGGTATGFAEIEVGDRHTDVRVSATARDAELDRYVASLPQAPGAAKRDKPVKGLMYGNVSIRGRSGPHGYLEGGGELFIRQAHVWKLPLAWLIFQVLNLAPDESVFHDGRIRFFFDRKELTLNRIDLQGKAMSFVGGGRMELSTGQLDVTLLAGSPVRIRVPFLTEILEGASREIMEVAVTGTTSNPIITPKPLKSLQTVLGSLFPQPARHSVVPSTPSDRK